METKEFKTTKATVISSSGNKSVTCQIDYKVKHPRYGKYINRRVKLGVHDPSNAASLGDLVEITECRPISKTKSWRLVKVLKKAVTE